MKETTIQSNFTYKNAKSMAADKARILAAFQIGRVCIVRAGYGTAQYSTQYAMLNVLRWNPSEGKHYISSLENNGLPNSWYLVLSSFFL